MSICRARLIVILQQRKKRKIYMPIQLIKRAFFFWGGVFNFTRFVFCFFVVVLFSVFWVFFHFKFCFSIRGPRGGGDCPSPTFVINGSKNKAINSVINWTNKEYMLQDFYDFDYSPFFLLLLFSDFLVEVATPHPH